MQAAPGTVSWAAAQPSILGWRGGGAPSASVKGRADGGGCRVRGIGMPRCCQRAQEKRPPRVRKSKEERREMVESFINSYRVSNEGKFPSVNLTHKEVGGSYYIVREIVRDIIQENRVLGPGGLDSMALSFEDYTDSLESCMKHEFNQANIEILNTSSDSQAGMGPLPEIPSTEESFSLQNSAISTQTLLGSSNILEAGVPSSVVQNGSAAVVETNLQKQDEVPSGKSVEVDSNTSEKQAHSFADVSASDEVIALNSQADTHDRDIISSESNAVYEINGALLREHETLSNDSHEGSTDSVVEDANLLEAANGLIQAKQPLQQHDASTESILSDDAQSLDGQSSVTNPINGFNPEAEVTTRTVEASRVHRLQDKLEQPLLNTTCEKENSDSPVSQLALDTKGLLHTEDQHSVVQVDESEFRKSSSGITKEEVKATDFRHEQGISTTTVISRRTSRAEQKKDDNLFWLVLRAFVVAISKIWAK